MTPKPEVFFVSLALGGSEGAMVGSAALARCRISAMFVLQSGKESGMQCRKMEQVMSWRGKRVDHAKAELLSVVFWSDASLVIANVYLQTLFSASF